MADGQQERDASEKPMGTVRVDLKVLGDAGCGKSMLAGQLVSKFGSARTAELADESAGGAALGGGRGPHFDAGPYRFAVSEAPGEAEELKMLTSSSFCGHADAALLVVSAAPGELERGLSAKGRTREHALLARALGAERLVVAVTKMDAAGNAYAEARFEEARGAVAAVLRAVGFAEAAAAVPVSGAAGENLGQPSAQMPWYSGPTLLQALGALAVPVRPVGAPLRATVREAYHMGSVGAVAVGCVEQGVLRLGAQVQFTPGGAGGRVKAIEVDGATVREAYPRDRVSFVTEGVGIEDLRRGMVASDAQQPALEAESFLAHIAVLKGPGEVRTGFSPILLCHAAQAPCRIVELVAKLDRRTGETLVDGPAGLRAGDVGLVRIRPEQPLCVEAHADCPQLGQFATSPEQTALAFVGVVREVRAKEDSGRKVV